MALWEGYRIATGSSANQPNVTFPEIVTIVLTCLTVALALFAVIAGLLAIWGYSNIKAEAAASAEKAIKSLLSGDSFRGTIKEDLAPIVEEVVRKEMAPITARLFMDAFSRTPQVGAETGVRLADRSPGEDDETR